MKRWFIKVVDTATSKNPGFPVGTRHDYWYGIREKLIASFYPDEPSPSPAVVSLNTKEYGFKTKAAAIRAYKSHLNRVSSTDLFGYWTSEVSLEETEVDGSAEDRPLSNSQTSHCHWMFRPGTGDGSTHFASTSCSHTYVALTKCQNVKPIPGCADVYAGELCPMCHRAIDMDYRLVSTEGGT